MLSFFGVIRCSPNNKDDNDMVEKIIIIARHHNLEIIAESLYHVVIVLINMYYHIIIDIINVHGQ